MRHYSGKETYNFEGNYCPQRNNRVIQFEIILDNDSCRYQLRDVPVIIHICDIIIYGVATASKIDSMIGLFSRIMSLS